MTNKEFTSGSIDEDIRRAPKMIKNAVKVASINTAIGLFISGQLNGVNSPEMWVFVVAVWGAMFTLSLLVDMVRLRIDLDHNSIMELIELAGLIEKKSWAQVLVKYRALSSRAIKRLRDVESTHGMKVFSQTIDHIATIDLSYKELSSIYGRKAAKNMYRLMLEEK